MQFTCINQWHSVSQEGYAVSTALSSGAYIFAGWAPPNGSKAIKYSKTESECYNACEEHYKIAKMETKK